MKGNRLILLVSSILLLTISSGLLFYKNLFLLESPGLSGKVDFEELRYTDLQTNATAALMRKNLNTDVSALEAEIIRIKELINIISDMNKSNEELSRSIKKVETYFEKKINDLNVFQTALKEFKASVDALNPAYAELFKNNIKFTVDKRDFYRDCVVDALYYVSSSNKANEIRLQEDRKILAQIISIASTPSPLIIKFSNTIDTLYKRSKDIDHYLESSTRENSMVTEMQIVGKYFKEYQDSKAHDGEIFLSMVFGAIVLYLICIVFILRKLT
jgi:archaellum component FlaC